jgi:hypothetical protein
MRRRSGEAATRVLGPERQTRRAGRGDSATTRRREGASTSPCTAAARSAAFASLPQLFQAVQTDGAHCWDGGSPGNPPLRPPVYDTHTPGIPIVRIDTIKIRDVPITARAIIGRVNTLGIGSSPMRGMRAIPFVICRNDRGIDDGGRPPRILIHSIDAKGRTGSARTLGDRRSCATIATRSASRPRPTSSRNSAGRGPPADSSRGLSRRHAFRDMAAPAPGCERPAAPTARGTAMSEWNGALRSDQPGDAPRALPAGTGGSGSAIDRYLADLAAIQVPRTAQRGGTEALSEAVARAMRRDPAAATTVADDGPRPGTGDETVVAMQDADPAAMTGPRHAAPPPAGTDRAAPADAAAGTSTTSTLTIDAAVPAESRIDRAGDVDWHRVVLEAGRSYRIEALGASSGWGSLGDPRIVAVNDARGKPIAGSGDASGGLGTDARLAFTPRETGVHYVVVDDGRRVDIPGSYRLSVRSDGRWADLPAGPATPAEAIVGGSVLGTVDARGDVDWFRAALVPGRSYRIELQASSAEGNALPDPALLGVFDAGGRLLPGTANDDYGNGPGARVTFTSPGGPLFVAAGSADARTGDYRLAIRDVTPPDLAAATNTTGTIAVNAVRTGRIDQPGDQDWFRVSLTAGQTYAIGLQRDPSSVLPLENPLLHGLFDAAGRPIAGTGNDDWGTGFDARVTYTAPATGSYFIAAGAHGTGTGDYVLSLARTAQPADAVASSVATTGLIQVGGAVSGRIDTAFDEDWYRVRLTGGERYTIDLRGAPSGQGTLGDPRFAGVFDAAGRLIPGTPGDNAPGTLDSRVVFAPATSGTYYLAAGGQGAQEGSYRLSIARAAGPAAPDIAADATTNATIAPGGSYGGAIERSGDVDWIRLRVEAGLSYAATLRADDTADGPGLADPAITGVFDARGLALAAALEPDIGGLAARDARAVFAAAAGGDVFVALRAQDGGTGRYRLSVDLVADTAPPVLVATTPGDGSGGIAPGASIRFSFNEPVRAGDGTIALAGGGTSVTIDAADAAQVRFDGTTMTVNPRAPLAPDTGYRVTLSPGSVEDLAGNDYGGNAAAPLDFVTATGPAPGTRDAWTLMVYIAADNDLEPFALRDLNEMESVRGLDAAGINVLVMADRAVGYSTGSGNWTDTRRAQIVPDGGTTTVGSLASATTSIGERNMGDPATLTEFIDWAKAAAPAERYGLVVWDHGGGLQGAAWDDASNGDRLTIREIRSAIDAASVDRFELIGFDCCQMAMTELAFALDDRAGIFVASQDNEPGDGWAYDRVLGRMLQTPAMSGAQLGEVLVETYAAAYAGRLGITLSATDLSRLGGVETALDRFVDGARTAAPADRAAIAAAASATLRFPSDGGAPWRDLVDFMEEVETRSADAAIDEAARGVIGAVRGAVYAHAGTVPEAEGLSINLPVGSQPVPDDYTAANYAFLARVDWNALLAMV